MVKRNADFMTQDNSIGTKDVLNLAIDKCLLESVKQKITCYRQAYLDKFYRFGSTA